MIKSNDPDTCIGCGACVRICPLDTLRMGEDDKAYIAYPDDCMTCFLCERACPSGAVDPLREVLPPPSLTCPWSLEEAAHEKRRHHQPR